MTNSDPQHLAAVLERISRVISADGHSQGLNPVQWEVLRYLAKANRFSNTPAAITAYLGITKGTVSQSVLSLEGKGLIRKVPDRKDGRSTRLSLTPRGLRHLKSDPLGETEMALRSLSEAIRKNLGVALNALLSNRLTARDRQPFGYCQNCRYFARHHPVGAPHWCQLVKEQLSEMEADKVCLEQRPK